MNIPIRSNHSNNKSQAQDKALEREIWRKLVVKVILWKENSLKQTDKITPKEWKFYCQKMVETNISYGRDKVLSTLKETRQIIHGHGGFK